MNPCFTVLSSQEHQKPFDSKPSSSLQVDKQNPPIAFFLLNNHDVLIIRDSNERYNLGVV